MHRTAHKGDIHIEEVKVYRTVALKRTDFEDVGVLIVIEWEQS